jgi:transposase-like protein
MTNVIITTFGSMLGSIQLKLSDFGVEKPKFENILTERFQNSKTPRNMNKTLNLLIGNHFEYINPICPICQSYNVNKQEFRERHPILGEFGSQTVYLRRYLCKDCGKKFITSLDSVIKPHYRYANIYGDKAKLLLQTEACSLRKLAENFYTFYDYLPSHQSIQNWLQTGVKKRITNEKAQYSGYYCYDEQYIKIKRIWHYRLTLYDFIQNIPVAEEIASKLTKKAIYNFIRETTENHPFYSLTTDHVPEYKKIADNFGVIHQQCIFHLYKMIGKLVYPILRKKTIKRQDKIRLALYYTEIKNIFRTFNENTAIQRLETLLEKYNKILKVLQKFIKNKIIPDFQRLTQFMRHPHIPRTSNSNENYYRQTNPEQIKRKYKKPEGLLNYANLKMQYWTKKHGKKLNPH